MQRKPLIAGNWKMHTTLVDGCELATGVAKAYGGQSDRDVLIAPPFATISEISHVIKDSGVILSGQNVCWEPSGAFTGEISPTMLLDAGAAAAIIGHSERRQLFGETDELINKRVRGALKYNLLAILCVGETLEERESRNTFRVIETQIQKGLEQVSNEQMKQVVIAYEPVWAIGTGKTASKEQAQEAHAFIRGLVENLFEKGVAEQIRILYGGSVKPVNIDELMEQPDIDGALVGGAALDAKSFGRIINFE